MNAQEFAAALVDLTEGRGAEPQAARRLFLLWSGAAQHRRCGGAADAFRKELESNPNDFGSNLQLGSSSNRTSATRKPASYFERALRVRPGDPGARYQLATPGRLPTIWMPPARASKKIDQGVASVRGGARLAGHGLLPPQAQGGRRPGAGIVLKLNAESQAKQPGARIQ